MRMARATPASGPPRPTDSLSRSQNAPEGDPAMRRRLSISAFVMAFLAQGAFADSTGYTPVATGFTLPNAQQAVTATSLSGTLDGSQITGNITNVGVVRASGNIVAGGNIVSTGYVNGTGGLYSGDGVYAT